MLYLSTKWKEIEESEIDNDFLMSQFLKDTTQTIYVCKKGELSGIITLGNFRRYFLSGQPLLQKSFIWVSENEEKRAEEILQNKGNIFAVPVLDENRHIVKEYRKQYSDHDNISADIVLELYKQFLPLDSQSKSIVVTRFESASQSEKARKIEAETAGRLRLMDERELLELNEFERLADYQVVYDCIRESFRIREAVYTRFGFTYSFVGRPAWKNEAKKDAYYEFLLHYESIGILSNEKEYFKPVLDAEHRIISLDERKFRWREDKNCFEYYGELEDVPEVICVSCCVLKNPAVLYGNHFIPVISKKFSINELHAHTAVEEARSSDYDFAYNIIPKLQEKGIKTLVISNVDLEWQKLPDFDEKEANLREKTSGEERKSMIKEFCIRAENEDYYNEYKNKQIINQHGYRHYADFAGERINIVREERLTVGNPASYKNTMWLFGPCLIHGTFVSDEYTIGSLLRKKVSSSYYIKNMGNMFPSRHMIARDSVFKEGDIVIIYAYDETIYREAGYAAHSLVEAYQQCPNLMEHIMDICNHTDRYLTEKVADKIYKILEENDYLTERDINEGLGRTIRFGIRKSFIKEPEQLTEWLNKVKKFKNPTSDRTGAIVMNCNPFTRGHRYLVETALKQVSRLLVFVVEEDKSFFKFEDRIAMVRLGTEDLENVTVIPSGKYIASAETFPGYFEKNDNPDVVFDATSDLNIFAEIIAKELDIKVRFAGEEPIDKFTRQYNRAMAAVLPEHGIEFVEIKRKEVDGRIISASSVRKLMSEGQFEEIRELVMPKIYEYLKTHYFG